MEVSGQLHAPVPIGEEAGRDSEPVWTWGRREESPFPAPAGGWNPDHPPVA